MPQPTPQSPYDILMPGGSPIGVAGPGRNVREVQGDQKAAEGTFNDLAIGGTPNTPVGYPGTGCDLPGGGWVGLRPVSKGGEPTIDVNVAGIPIKKIKFK